jgi:hypothetical protein
LIGLFSAILQPLAISDSIHNGLRIQFLRSCERTPVRAMQNRNESAGSHKLFFHSGQILGSNLELGIQGKDARIIIETKFTGVKLAAANCPFSLTLVSRNKFEL